MIGSPFGSTVKDVPHVLLSQIKEAESASWHSKRALATHKVPVTQSPRRTDRLTVAAQVSPGRAGLVVFALFKNGAGGDLGADRTSAQDQDGNPLELVINVTSPPHAGGEGGGYFAVAFPRGTTYVLMDFNKQGSVSDWVEAYGYGLYGTDKDVSPTATHWAQSTGSNSNKTRESILPINEDNVSQMMIVCGTGWNLTPQSYSATTNRFQAGSRAKGTLGLIQSTPGQNRGYLTSHRGYNAEITITGALRF